jgi:hypothetical protein
VLSPTTLHILDLAPKVQLHIQNGKISIRERRTWEECEAARAFYTDSEHGGHQWA